MTLVVSISYYSSKNTKPPKRRFWFRCFGGDSPVFVVHAKERIPLEQRKTWSKREFRIPPSEDCVEQPQSKEPKHQHSQFSEHPVSNKSQNGRYDMSCNDGNPHAHKPNHVEEPRCPVGRTGGSDLGRRHKHPYQKQSGQDSLCRRYVCFH